MATDPSVQAYEQVLRRGLEQPRREKGDGHEETLAHLAALAAHFEGIANTTDVSSDLSAVVLTKAEARKAKAEAARPFAEEHARITERKKQQAE